MPRTRIKRITKSRGPRLPPEWDDGFARNAQIPEYRAYNDIYTQGYKGPQAKPGTHGRHFENVKSTGGLRQKSQIYSHRTEYGPPPPANNPRNVSRRGGQAAPSSGYAFSASKRPSHPETASLSSQRGNRPRPHYASAVSNISGQGNNPVAAQKLHANTRTQRTLRTSGSQGSLASGMPQQARPGQLVGPHALAA